MAANVIKKIELQSSTQRGVGGGIVYDIGADATNITCIVDGKEISLIEYLAQISGDTSKGLQASVIADPFVTTKTYYEKDLVTYDNQLQRCINKHNAGDFNNANFEIVSVEDAFLSSDSYITVGLAKGATAGENATVEGYNNIASGSCSHAEGQQTYAIGEISHTEGQQTTASGPCSHAEGEFTIAEQEGSHAEGIQTKARKIGSHAEGNGTSAHGDFSHTEGLGTSAHGNCSHTEGSLTLANEEYSHAEGRFTRAMGQGSHTEGLGTSAFGDYSHAEGNGNKVNITGKYAHVEGENSTAQGEASHAEGGFTSAYGERTHTEGNNTTAYGKASHAEGIGTYALGLYSHAEGAETTASNCASVSIGHYNAAMTTGGSPTNTTGTAFVIGNGTSSSNLSNAFAVEYDGTVSALGHLSAANVADYAEYFEQADGNQENEDRVGYFVTFDEGKKIRIANDEDDYILGVISGAPFVVGNGDCGTQNGMYVRDKFNRICYEPAPLYAENDDPITDNNGHQIYQGKRPIINPNYDSTKSYIKRSNRPEQAAVGMLGVLSVRDDGTCVVNSYCKINKDGIATKADKIDNVKKYRVIERKAEDVIEIVFSI